MLEIYLGCPFLSSPFVENIAFSILKFGYLRFAISESEIQRVIYFPIQNVIINYK